MKNIAFLLLIFMTSCVNITITIVHTQGIADDVVEEQQEGPDVKTDLTVPVSAV